MGASAVDVFAGPDADQECAGLTSQVREQGGVVGGDDHSLVRCRRVPHGHTFVVVQSLESAIDRDD